jgi:hypothetical protein
MLTSGSPTNGLIRCVFDAVRRFATTSGSRTSPSSACSIVSPMRVARRPSSSSRSYSRVIAMVSSAMPSVVV